MTQSQDDTLLTARAMNAFYRTVHAAIPRLPISSDAKDKLANGVAVSLMPVDASFDIDLATETLAPKSDMSFTAPHLNAVNATTRLPETASELRSRVRSTLTHAAFLAKETSPDAAHTAVAEMFNKAIDAALASAAKDRPSHRSGASR